VQAASSTTTSITTFIKEEVKYFVGNMTSDTTMEAQKKRTMDALEKRFASAKAEVLQQQEKLQKSKNMPNLDKDHINNKRNVASPSAHASSAMPSPTASSKKGNVSLSSHNTPKDTPEANDSTYHLLSHPIHENLLTTNDTIPEKKGSVVNHVLHELLQKGDAAQKYMQGSKNMKVDHTILLDNFVQGNSSRSMALPSRSKRSTTHMSMKQLKKSDLFNVSQDLHSYEKFKPMHEIWKDYILQHLKNVGKLQLARSLLSADLHGAIILVAECKRATYTGVCGIMIRETAETFGLIAQDNKFRVVPKRGSVFMLQADSWKVTLHGDKLANRNLLP
jgi:ribonuclease P protein subunit POP4